MTDISWSNMSEETRPDMWDFYELFKPRVMRLVVFTAFVGLFVAPVSVHPILAVISILCIALGAGASGALNMYIDADIDAVMKRTQSRPIPSKRVPREYALYLGVFASVLSVALLGLYANWFAAGLLAFTIFFYVVIYSLGLKRNTPQNIVIGGAAGAFPPMIGWAVATGGVSLESVMMFMVIFLWTPPHFWALALFRNDDYQAANVPMMPVVKGELSTRRQIFIYSVILSLVAMMTSFTSIGGIASFLIALIGAAGMVGGGFGLYKRKAAERDEFRAEKRYFAFSIIYLFAFFLALIIDAFLKGWFTFAANWPVLGG